eukprot:4537502-Pyramimonas_sp.AAC.1
MRSRARSRGEIDEMEDLRMMTKRKRTEEEEEEDEEEDKGEKKESRKSRRVSVQLLPQLGGGKLKPAPDPRPRSSPLACDARRSDPGQTSAAEPLP